MEKTILKATIFSSVFLLSFLFFVSTTLATDSECIPPYSGYGGTVSSCSQCPAGYPVCAGSQGNYYCYQSTKVGAFCTNDATSQSGTCNSQGDCITTGGGTICPEGQICNPLKYDTFEKIVGAISKFLFNIGLALASVMLVIAGFMYVTSAGDPERVKTARKMALYTLVGLAIILLASGLIKVLESILGVAGT